MPGELTPASTQAAQVHRLVGAISAVIHEQVAIRSFPIGSRRLLYYFTELADATKAQIQPIAWGPAGPTDEDRLNTLTLIGWHWSILHGSVKPLVDAHSLRVPAPLLFLLRRQLSRLPDLTDTEIAVEVVPQLNYLQRPHTYLRDVAAGLVGYLLSLSEPSFPDKLGIVGLPYTQSASLFYNCSLYHELGHFVYEQTERSPEIKQAVAFHLGQALSSSELNDKPHVQEIERMVCSWCEELFCDLFAVRIIGPVYALVSAHVFNLLERPSEVQGFSVDHPSTAFRLHHLREQLRSMGWWDYLTKEFSQLTGTIDETIDPSTAPTSDEIPDKVTKQVFPGLVSNVFDLVDRAVPKPAKFQVDFADLRVAVWANLAHGLVPPAMPPKGVDPVDYLVSVINAAYLFQQAGLEQLFDTVQDARREQVSDHALLAQRVEEWTLRAVEYALGSE